MFKYAQKKYGKLAEIIFNRGKVYNNSLNKIKVLEESKDIFVIRPSCDLKVKRLEKNIEKITKIYNLGLSDTEKIIDDLKKYLNI